jgi:DNA-binding CsgD family transcriptional regulator
MRLIEHRLGRALEAIYDTSLPPQAWLGEIVEALGDLLGAELHAVSTYRWKAEQSLAEFTSPMVTNVPDAHALFFASFPQWGPEEHEAMFCGPPVMTMRSRFPDDEHPSCRVASSICDHDWLGIQAFDSDGVGCFAGLSFPDGLALGRAETVVLAHLAAHWTAAHRARRHGGAIEAIFEADGRVAHAEPAAQPVVDDELRQKTRWAERARSDGATAAEALAAWTAIVQGRWSLVQTVDSDGRRYVVAQENEPRSRLPALTEPQLTPTQIHALTLMGRGYAQKAIAYELGLSPARVSRLLARARVELGLASSADLVRVARAALGYRPLGPTG